MIRNVWERPRACRSSPTSARTRPRTSPIQGYAVTADWSKQYPNTLKAFTTALSQGQQAADTDRAAVETALQKYLGIPPRPAAFISLPAFPLGMDAVRLQRVVSAMTRFGLPPKATDFQITGMLGG